MVHLDKFCNVRFLIISTLMELLSYSFDINVRNTVNEAIAWWQSNTKQHSHLIDGLLLLSIVCHFLSLISLIKVYHHHFLQHLKLYTFQYIVSPLSRKVLSLYRNYCHYHRYFREIILWWISQSVGGTVNTLRNDTPLMWKSCYLQKMIGIRLA